MITNNRKEYIQSVIFSDRLTQEILKKIRLFFNFKYKFDYKQKVYNAVFAHVVKAIIENIVYRSSKEIIYSNYICNLFLPRNLNDFYSQLQNKNFDAIVNYKFYNEKNFASLPKSNFTKIILKNIFLKKNSLKKNINVINCNKKKNTDIEFFKLDYRHKDQIDTIVENNQSWKISNLKNIKLFDGKKNKKLRKEFLNFFDFSDKKSFFILKLFLDILPSKYFEMFFINISSVANAYDEVPLVIISNAHCWNSSDIFKFYLALSLMNGSRYVDVQINGAHFLTKFSYHHDVSKNFYDYFISWGHKSNNKKIVNLPCLYNCREINLPINKSNKKILYVGASVANHFRGYWGSVLDGDKISIYQRSRDNFFSNLDQKVKNKFLIRTRDTSVEAKNRTKKFLLSNKLSKSLDPICETLTERLLKGDIKFVVTDHISTPLFEIIHSNIPFLFFLDESTIFFNENYNFIIKKMIKEKILFFNLNEASDRTLQFHDKNDLQQYWNKNKNIQDLRKELMCQLFNHNKNWKSLWKHQINEISKFN